MSEFQDLYNESTIDSSTVNVDSIKVYTSADFDGAIVINLFDNTTIGYIGSLVGVLDGGITDAKIVSVSASKITGPIESEILADPLQVKETSGSQKFVFETDSMTTDKTLKLKDYDDNDYIVAENTLQNILNKNLDDSSVYFVNTTDSNKKIRFELVNLSTSRTLTIQDEDQVIVGRDTTDTLTNKTLTLPIISQISNTGTLTLPTSTDTLIGRNTTDTLTNKTLTSTSNNVAAKGLHSATTIVDVSAASAPSSGQILTATSSTTATWQNGLSGFTNGAPGYSTGYGNTLPTNATYLNSEFFGSRPGNNSALFAYNECTIIGNENAGFNVGFGSGYIMDHAVVIGYRALRNCFNGDDTVAIGHQAGQSVTSGRNNTIVGSNSATNLTTGFQNTFLGNACGSGVTTGNWNTFIGDNARLGGNNDGNTLIGHNTGAGITTGSGNTCIGIGSYVTAGINNCVVLGNSNFGNVTGGLHINRFSPTGFGTTVIFQSSNGFVGPQSSSARFKNNIRSLNEDKSYVADSSKIFNTRPVLYEYKTENYARKDSRDQKTHLGYLAEEISDLYPAVCVYEPDDKDNYVPYSVRYDLLTIPIIEEMKKMKNEIQELKKEINLLKRI